MSQIPIENDDNRSVAASDFVKLEPPDDVPDQQEQEEQQNQGQSQFGLNQSFDSTLDTGSTHKNNYENVLTEQKLMIEKLEAKIQTVQSKLENLELKAENRALKETAEQKANYQALEAKVNEVVQMLSTQKEEHHKEMAQLKDEFAQMLSSQNEQHHQDMAQLASKNRKLEEKLVSDVEVLTAKNGALDSKEQLQDEFSMKLAEQQQQMMEQFQFQEKFHFSEQKLKEAEQWAQTGKNEMKEIIQQKMDKFREEMDKNGQQASGSNLSKSKILANPKGIVWDGPKTGTRIAECGLTPMYTGYKGVFVIATEGYAISGEHCRKENNQFPGTILFYYEVALEPSCGYSSFGFTNGSKHTRLPVGGSTNSYGIEGYNAKIDSLWLSGNKHKLYRQIGFIADRANVVGSGLLLNSKNELAVFFTFNGILLGKQIRINPTVDRLYPTISTYDVTVRANFGSNLVAKPFKFDVDNCPGLVFE